MEVKHSLRLDMRLPGNRQVMYAKQYDANTRTVELLLHNAGSAFYRPSDLAEMQVCFGKPDGHGGCYSALEGGSSACSWEANTNIVTVRLHPQVLTAAGTVLCELQLLNTNGDMLSTFSWQIEVEPSAADGTSSEDYYNISLQTLRSDLDAAQEAVARLTGLCVPFAGATEQAPGSAGLVPAPAVNDRNKVLFGSGGWYRPDASGIDVQSNKLQSRNVADALDELKDEIDQEGGGGAVSSVNGKTGAVTLDAGDIDVNFTLDAQNANVEEALNDIGDAVTALRASVPAAPVRNAHVHSINHRGYNTEAPENTLPAFLLSKARGFVMVETDVCFTSDGVAVLLHDDTINRTARNADGTELSATVNISDITYAQALEYDFGIWKDAKYAGTRIPTLEEFLQLCKDNALHPYIEIKNSGVVNGQVTAEMTALLRDSAVAVAKDMDMLGRITWISFSAPILAKLAELDAVSRLGYIVSQGNNGGITDTVIQEVRAIDPTIKRVFIDSSSYTAAEISRCKAAEIPLEIWTLDDWTGVSPDPYITGVTSNYRIAGEVLQNNDSRVRDASHVVIPWTRANGLSSSNGSDSSTGDYRMLLMDFLPVRKNEVYQFHSRVSESDFLSTSDHKMVTVVAYYDEKQRFLRGTYSSLSNPNVVNGYCVRKDAISITGTNADARYIRISFRSMNTASYGLLRVRDANGELTPSLERLLFERLESTDAQAATLAAQLTPMTGATAQAAGTAGLVPAPASGKHAQFLRGDGTWNFPESGNIDLSNVETINGNTPDTVDEALWLLNDYIDTLVAQLNTALAAVVGGGSNG